MFSRGYAISPVGATLNCANNMVRVPQHHRDRFPAAQLLDRIDIDPRLDQPGGKGVPEVMEAEPRNSRLSHRRIERP